MKIAMKQILFTLIFLQSVIFTFAQSVKLNGIDYWVDRATRTASVSYIYKSGAVIIPSSITYRGAKYLVTSISGADASDNGGQSMTSITIPHTIKEMALEFSSFESLSSIIIAPNNPVYCSENNVVFNKNKTKIIYCSRKKKGSYTIPNSVTNIGEYAFCDCSDLTSVSIPNSVKSIGDRAFGGCEKLNSLKIPNSVTNIGEWAFTSCKKLNALTIPNSVTSIGESAFCYCSGLTSIIVEKGNSQYDSRDNCSAIIETNTNTLIQGCNNTTIPNSVTSIAKHAFCGCSRLSSIIIPNSVRSIGEDAFSSCSGLTSITISNTVKSIEDRTFYGCEKLHSITIPNSVKYIAFSAFRDCSGLTSIIISNSIKSIGEWAFTECNNLNEITVLNPIPPTIGDPENNSASEVIPKATRIYVPAESVNAYKAASGWKDFRTRIYPISK